MIAHTPHRPRSGRRPAKRPRVLWAAAVVLVLAPWVRAQEEATFSVRHLDQVRAAETHVLDQQGVSHVPLSTLVIQFGGGCRVAPERIQVDFAGKTAWLCFDETEVKSSLGHFSLTHPILPMALSDADLDALIAVEDVAAFFYAAFRVTVSRAKSPGPPAEADAPALDVLEPLPLTPLEVEAPPPAETRPVPAAGYKIEVIIIDPGHGGNDPGCVGKAGLKESELALALARNLEDVLGKNGNFKVFLTRAEGRNPARKDRASSANSNGGDLLVSIHAAASYSPNAYGFEVFCCKPAGTDESLGGIQRTAPGELYAAASRAIADSVAASLGEVTGAENRGVREVRCPLLADVSMPAILVEAGFLTNQAEEAVLRGTAYQAKLAAGIAMGITNYLGGARTEGAAP